MPKRSSKTLDEEVELNVRSPMMGSKANGSKKKNDNQKSLKTENKENGAKSRKNYNQRKPVTNIKENATKTKNGNQKYTLVPKESDGENRRSFKANGAKGNGDQRQTVNGNNKSLHQKGNIDGDQRSGTNNDSNGAKKDNINSKTRIMATKESDKKGPHVDDNDKSSNCFHRTHKKRVFLICLVLILVLLVVLSVIVAVLLWTFTMGTDTGQLNNTTENPKDTAIRLDVDIHLDRNYTEDYADDTSDAYKDLSKFYLTQMNNIFESSALSESYMYTVINQFRPGSVIVSSSSYFANDISTSYLSEEDYFNTLRTDVENELRQGAVKEGALGPLVDVDNAVVVKKPVVVETPSIKDDTTVSNEIVTQPKPSEKIATEEMTTNTIAIEQTSKVSKPDPDVEEEEEEEESSDVCGLRPGMRRRRKRIVGGSNSPFGSMPWIGSVRRSPDGHYCAATLLNARWAVTAAHCLGNTENIVFGDLYLDWPSDYHEEVNISAVFPYPDYDFFADRADKPNDIALLRLARPVKLSSAVRPACIANSLREMHEYRHCTAAGWGISDYRSANTNRLQEVPLPLVPMNDCRTFYADSPHVLPDLSSLSISSQVEEVGDVVVEYDPYNVMNNNTSVVSDRMICAGGYPEGGKGVCRADNGGPLVCLGKDDLWYIVGVGSWSWGCDLPNIPNVFARVSVFQDFIHETMRHTEECIKDASMTSCFKGCVGGEDCLKQCRADDFLCKAGYCIPGEKACDDHVDCADGSDERGYARCLDDCGDSNIVVNPGLHTVLQSPGFPIVYPDFYRCQWQLTASEGGRILVNFTDFDLETDYDFLHVGVGLEDSDKLFSLTGSDRQLDIISPGSSLVFTFSSDVSSGLKGFSLLATEIPATDFDACDNGVQVVPTDRDIFCNDIVDCADYSDEPTTCYNHGRRDLCGRESILVSEDFPANISYIEYSNFAQCKWVVNADTLSARLRVTFFRFDLESNYDHLAVSTSLGNETPKLSYTGHKMPPDIISPGPSLVITFETDDTGVDEGFLLQVSMVEDTDTLQDVLLCANGMEVLPDADLCNGYYDCQDKSDEKPGCECGDPLLTITPSGTISLTSYKYPQNYHRSITCQWTVRTQSGGKIAAKFNAFSLENNYDFLHIGTSRQPKLLSLTGDSLPLDIVSPDSELVITFQTDYSISDRGFSMALHDGESDSDSLQFCDNGIEIVAPDGKGRQKCHN